MEDAGPENTPVDTDKPEGEEGDAEQDEQKKEEMEKEKELQKEQELEKQKEQEKDKEHEKENEPEKQKEGDGKAGEKDLFGCPSPTPSGQSLPDEEVKNMVTHTLELLGFIQKKMDEQKIETTSMAFLLLRIKESMDQYCNEFMPNLNTYLVSAETLTGEYLKRTVKKLPSYGDYIEAIKREQGEKIEAGGDEPIEKNKLLTLVDGVTDNYFSESHVLLTLRSILSDINEVYRNERSDICYLLKTPFPDWMTIKDNLTCQLDTIREHAVKIATYVDFMKHGEAKNGPTLDLTPLEAKTRPKKF